MTDTTHKPGRGALTGQELGHLKQLALYADDAMFLREARRAVLQLILDLDEARGERDKARKERKKFKPIDPAELCVPVPRFDFSSALSGYATHKLFRRTAAKGVCDMVRKYWPFLTVGDRRKVERNVEEQLKAPSSDVDRELPSEWAELLTWMVEQPEEDTER